MLVKRLLKGYDRSLPVLVLVIYNFVVSVILYKQEELQWLPNGILTTDKKYTEKVGIELTKNLTTSSFGVVFCFFNFLFSSLMIIPILFKNSKFKTCLFLGLLWNVHAAVSFFNNAIEIVYDSFKLNAEYSTLIKLVLTTAFLLGLHLLLILESLIFYDQMNIESKKSTKELLSKKNTNEVK